MAVSQLLRWMIRAIDSYWTALVDVILDAKLLPPDAIVKRAQRQTILIHAAKRGRVRAEHSIV